MSIICECFPCLQQVQTLATGFSNKNEHGGKHEIFKAAKSLSADKLRTLLDKNRELVHEKDIDVTPFHVVAYYTTYTNFSKAYKAIETLIEFEADINCPAIKSDFHTPFSLLMEKFDEEWKKDEKKIILLNLLIDKYNWINVDSFRDGGARVLLQKNFKYLDNKFPKIPPGGYNDKSKDELLGELSSIEVESEFSLELGKLLVECGDKVNAIIKKGVLLEVLINKGFESSVKELLRMGSNINKVSQRSPCTPLDIACQRGFWNTVEILSTHAEISFEDQNRTLLHSVVKNFDLNTSSPECDYKKCFDMLMNCEYVDLDEQDLSKNTALHYAVCNKNEYAIKKLLEKSPYIGTPNIFEKLPIQGIPPDLLESYFDSCITTNGKRSGDDDYEIRIDYSCLVPLKLRPKLETGSIRVIDLSTHDPLLKRTICEKEMAPIEYIANTNELRHLIQHPLMSSFLFLKWLRLSPVFYLNLLVCIFYYTSLIAYIVFYFDHINSCVFKGFSICGAIYVFIREFFQFFASPCTYFCRLVNYLEIGLVLLTIEILCTHFFKSFHEVFGAVIIILAAVELSLLVGYLPYFSMSTHMVMLKTVSKTFLRGLALYSIFLVAFAFSFYTLFSPNHKKNDGLKGDESNGVKDEPKKDDLNKFTNPGLAIIKTIVMLTGEFDASSIDFRQNWTNYLIFILFLFFMFIVVLNLLNGLAVSDTQIIKSEAELNNWLERIKLLTHYENSLLCLQRWHVSIISLFPDFLPLHKIHVRPNKIKECKCLFNCFHWKITYNQIVIPLLTGQGGKASEKEFTGFFACIKRAAMDKKIVKCATEVLIKKERQEVEAADKSQLKERIKINEKTINTILKAIENLELMERFENYEKKFNLILEVVQKIEKRMRSDSEVKSPKP